ncbi:voltage-dependent anion-selective channel-like [Choristoneura fumiferana]|uniref:voltage-dependent anion-selective channel-like n=1 Tax=Choristoneura fumiferana TaxID=7141 RepID=UPI003D15F06F
MAAEAGSSPPPYYADLGKKANDVFGKGYHFGVFKLDLKTKSESGVEFTSGITSNQESGKVRESYVLRTHPLEGVPRGGGAGPPDRTGPQ